ncbi:hypothetical protein K458DRAFT_297194, partial [Lentithecium fluviatile CBS 122367]
DITRLYLQHRMCTTEMGILVNPQVPLGNHGLKVADIACGTGIWLVDLAKHAPKSVQLDGFNISTAHFPPKDELPTNVNLMQMDTTTAIPDRLVGRYDVVHSGRTTFYILNEDPSLHLRNFVALLSFWYGPGGYLFWDELDLGAVHPRASDPSISYDCADKMEAFGRAWLQSQGVTTRWVGRMDAIFQEHGLQVLDFKRVPVSDGMARP